MNKQLIFFFIAVVFMAAGMGVHDSIFNNFLSETYNLTADSRGWLEFPRELPGFLVFLMTGILAALPITQLGIIGAFAFTLGMAGMAYLGNTYTLMVGMMVLASSGMHLLQPVSGSLAIGLSEGFNRGKRMGQLGFVDTAGVIIGTGLIWLFFDRTDPKYWIGFVLAGGLALVSGLVYSQIHVPHLHQPRARIYFHKQFSLYYLMELIYGARKQIFLTFGPWVLIQVYGKPAAGMAGLLMTAAFIGLVFKPLAGLAIDRFGERTVMITDGIALIFVCLGYGYAIKIMPDMDQARFLASACFIADNLLFALSSARAVYLSRLTENPAEITSTLSLGVSINHIASMTIPAFAGALWVHFGYERVFLAAAGLAVLIAMLSTWVPTKTGPAESQPVPIDMDVEESMV